MKAHTVKWGNSVAVRIPKPITEYAKLKEGDSLDIESGADGHVELRRVVRVLTLAQLVAKITPENHYAEITTTSEVGKEIVKW
ncbi:MAG: AbrB/MazE/SpoVT family DNA-binding domain-containing protein [Terriglobales bacterium]